MGSVRKWYSRNVIPSEAEGSFLHTGITPYVWQREVGNLSRKEKKQRVQGKNKKLHIIPIYLCYKIILYRKRTPFMKNTIYFFNLYF